VSLGPAEILVILVIALLVFGPTRLPEVGRQVGRTMREFRKFQQVMKRDLDEVFRDDHVADVSHAAAPAPTLAPKRELPSAPPDEEIGEMGVGGAGEATEPVDQTEPTGQTESEEPPARAEPDAPHS
jgi:sec-independent protein translocase protein TatA